MRQTIEGDRWIVEAALPRRELTGKPLKTGGHVYLNLVRATHSAYRHRACCPTSDGGFMATDPMGELTFAR